MRHVAVEEGIHDDGAAGIGEQIAAQTDKTARGHAKFEAHATVAVIVHLRHFTFAWPEALDDGADEGLGNVDGEMFDRFHELAVDFFRDDLGTADHELITFAAHHLDEDGELELAAAEDFEAVGRAGFFNAHGNVGEELFLEALTQIARGDPLTFASHHGRIVDGKLHGDGGLVDDDGWQRGRVLGAGDGFADGDALDSGDGDDVVDLGFFNVDALEAAEAEELGNAGLVERAVEPGDGDVIAGAQSSLEDAGDGEAAEVVGVVEVGDENLEDAGGVAFAFRSGIEDGLEKRLQIFAGNLGIEAGVADLRVGVEDRKVELVLGGVKIDEEIVDLVEDFLGARVGAVDFVDDEDGREARFESFGEDVAGLRQRAFGSVDEEHDAIDHFEGAFDFAAEVGVARSVDDVDLLAFVVDGGVFGEDGDAALALQLVRVHDAVGDGFVSAEGAGLAEELIDEGGLAVVDVGDDGDVANLAQRRILFSGGFGARG